MIQLSRTQRRNQMRADKKQEQRIPPVQIQYAHNGQCVLMLFRQTYECTGDDL